MCDTETVNKKWSHMICSQKCSCSRSRTEVSSQQNVLTAMMKAMISYFFLSPETAACFSTRRESCREEGLKVSHLLRLECFAQIIHSFKFNMEAILREPFPHH